MQTRIRWAAAVIALCIETIGMAGASPGSNPAPATRDDKPPATTHTTKPETNSSSSAKSGANGASSSANGGASANGSAASQPSAAYPQVSVVINQSQLSTPGVLMNGHALVPIQDVVAKLGGKALWDPQGKSLWAVFPKQKRTLRMVIDSPEALIYEYAPKDPHRTGNLITTTHLVQSPILLGGNLLAPADAIGDAARAKVFYKPEAKQVTIMTRTGQRTRSAHQQASR